MALPLNSGEVLRGRYKIRQRIGQGGIGSIYLADDQRLEGRLCAIKEVEHDRSLPAKIFEEAREQFMREATVLARLDHPNLPKVSDFFSQNKRDYLVMDYVPGEDLRDLMLDARRRKTFLREDVVLGWANQIANALTYLHRQDPPIIHRDIKPSNLKLTPSGLVKLVDFGLVKVLVPDEMTITVIQGQGTILYTPLEQYGSDGVHTDVRSDVYSLGATLYHLLTNKAPADARNRFLNPDSLLPPKEINSSISNRTQRGIRWAISLHPDERPDSVEDFRLFLLGQKEIITSPLPQLLQQRPAFTLGELLTQPTEQALAWVAVGMLLLSLLATLGN
ncbi:MAG: serine/threonine protein kinase [Anaerolineales bacterium]|uniref:non-specific serine/threonine protein kinase n=1 Tax=Candidatus Desulfolinea nitratireducens TaxID=2841698 RepID=A0A8J6NGQ4_9CHLR|nr:serine/threonine protein kinase [Candidatus Desulfolinea nitratireducens]MBL6961171.1 serine/threonine protein kinase [Anaerolineales bacterium]